MRKRLLLIAGVLTLAVLGAWAAVATFQPKPRLELRAGTVLHACFFSDDGSELVTDFTSQDEKQRGYIAWDTVTGKEKERWAVRNEKADPEFFLLDSLFEKHRVTCTPQGERMLVRAYQVRPWKLLCSFTMPPTTIERGIVCPLRRTLLLEFAGAFGPVVALHDLATGSEIKRVAGTLVGCSPRGRYLVTSVGKSNAEALAVGPARWQSARQLARTANALTESQALLAHVG